MPSQVLSAEKTRIQCFELIPGYWRRQRLDRRSIPGAARRARRRHHERNEAVIRLVVTRDFHTIDHQGELAAAVVGSALGSDVPAHVLALRVSVCPVRRLLSRA